MKTETETTRIGHWITHSVTVKLVIVIILTLLLLIPSEMIKSIISERESLSQQTVQDVSSKWAERQLINGPILTIPLLYEQNFENTITYNTVYWHVLPQHLYINGNLEPQTLRRGIYEVAVYNSILDLKGSFILDEQVDKTNLSAIQYDKAFLTIGISDLRGIKDNIILKWRDQDLNVHPGSRIPHVIESGITIDLPDITDLKNMTTGFDLSIHLQGSQNLSFVPIGATTEVNLQSSWTSPSFNGNFLPDTREVTDAGFQASWKVLQLNRNFPQTWTGASNSYNLTSSAFGVDLILMLDDYQKSMRSIKYAIMTIALTFLIFFLVEILNKRRIHPFQYALVGLALCLFYVLLVSISEHSNFNLAYGMSFVAILLMISLYSIKIFKTLKLTLLLVLCLIGIYGFVYVTLQLTDYALLMGSIGLALILSLTMYFTRNIDWYKLKIAAEK
ncbi:MAG TPA: cell envelope integrity protein CreD [Saprospiraceae bacterium]|nr:cell envelope integrity protein CreD [Saprospiraceae bacterium]